MVRVIGVDLGTFNSCVALMEDGRPIVLNDRHGWSITPSIVAVAESGRQLVGRLAKRQAVTNAENTVYAAKRLIGRRWSSDAAQRMRESVAYEIVAGPHDDPRIKLAEKIYSLPEISAMILRELKLIAEDYLGEMVSQAVITVPAYFNDGQRQATRDAGAIAGLEVLQILNEPTSAALAYGFGKRVDRTLAVYDLGGGTFDISILELSRAGVFKVIATEGDTFLGGEDFDQRIIDVLMQEIEQECGLDLRRNRMALQRIRDAAEMAKSDLSGMESATINLPFLATPKSNEPFHLTRELGRPELESLTRDLVERTLDLCDTTLEEAGCRPSDIDEVLLVGGMTRMPLVRRRVGEFFGAAPTAEVNPDEVVALGAAIHAGSLVDGAQDTVLLDVTPLSLGIVVAGGGTQTIVPQNSTVPIARSKVFTTVRDNQTTVKIIAVQGEAERAEDNELLGKFALTGLRAAPAGKVEIEVTFELDQDGIVQVRAKDLETNALQSITITASSGLTDEELDEMIGAADAYAMAEKADAELEAARAEIGELIEAIEALTPRVLEAVGDNDYARKTVDDALGVLEEVKGRVPHEDAEALRPRVETLKRTLRLFQGAAAAV